MKLQFNLEYQTTFGEELMLNIFAYEDRGEITSYPMTTLDGYHWSYELNYNPDAVNIINYFYSLHKGDEQLRREWPMVTHELETGFRGNINFTTFDHWLDTPEDAYMYSSAFTDCVLNREKELSSSNRQHSIRLKVRASQLRENERLAIVGAPECLGSWNPQKALAMIESQYNEWTVSIDADKLPVGNVEFKFIICQKGRKKAVIWEEGNNRSIFVPQIDDHDCVVYELPQAVFPVAPWRGAGTVIPVFSLRSEGSFGVGDFGDLRMMIDWAAKTNQRVLQILPINDTNITHTWQDSYPYNSISIYALHPQYTDLRQLPALKDKTLAAHFEALRQELNALSQIDYERMFAAKMEYLHAVFAQEWESVSELPTYKLFTSQNREWLKPYAKFCYYRDLYGTATFSKWPKKLQKLDQDVLNFWYFVQYYLDKQMRTVHQYARQKRVILKGDIPIGISRDGVEAWVEPKYFNLNGQAGAPPDAFSTDGQNWGFPTYNWDEMLKDGCSWWVRRFSKMAEYFDAYRIDHVLGFFRIWEIPVPEKSGLMGQFAPALGFSKEEIKNYGVAFNEGLFLIDHKRDDRWHPRIAVQYQQAYQQLEQGQKDNFNRLYNDYFYRRNNHFWYQEAMKKLPLLTQATRMLVCAEDLGMVPDCVPWVMNELRILSLEIQTMPKDPNVRFGQLSRNPYRSVCTFSTHDMPTLRQWWDEDMGQTQAFYNTVLQHDGDAPHPLPGTLATEVVSQQLSSPSMLCLLSLQDWLSTDEKLRLPDANAERINVPAIPRYYWRYRMHLTIEQLLQADVFNDTIKSLIKQSGRE